MKDAQLISKFVRATGPLIEVQIISWTTPFTPESKWVQFEILPADPKHAAIAAAKKRALADPRYFTRCRDCGELNPAGGMHDHATCQSCARHVLGAIF